METTLDQEVVAKIEERKKKEFVCPSDPAEREQCDSCQ